MEVDEIKMPTTHLVCETCKEEFDYVMGPESYLVHLPGNTKIITSDGGQHATTSIKILNKHRITCPYCGNKAWYKVNI